MASARFISFCAGRLENEAASTARVVNMLFLMFYYIMIKLFRWFRRYLSILRAKVVNRLITNDITKWHLNLSVKKSYTFVKLSYLELFLLCAVSEIHFIWKNRL